MDHRDLRAYPDREKRATAIVEAAVLQPFDLSGDILIRTGLLQLADEEHLFFFIKHHIISDGWSMQIFVKELISLYAAFRSGKEDPLAPLRVQYKDYAIWQHNELRAQQNDVHRAYWLDQFRDDIPVLNLPADHARPSVRSYAGNSKSFQLDGPTSRKLLSLSRQHSASLFMTLLATVNVLLYRYTGQQDIVIGSPVAGRDHRDLEEQIGFYVNMLALRNQVAGSESFERLLGRIRNNTLNAYEHQAYPFDWLVNELPIVRDMSRSPLFDVVVILQNKEQAPDTTDMKGLRIEGYDNGMPKVSTFDLMFNFSEAGDNIIVSIEYNMALFDTDRINRMAVHYGNLVKAIVEDSRVAIDELEYITDTEKAQLITTFNDTATGLREVSTVVSVFREQVSRAPDNIALRFGTTRFTYLELDRRSNQWAHYLRGLGIVKGTPIAICLDRSAEMIICILGILKAGAVYVPVNPSYPAERIRYMLSDMCAGIVICSQAHSELLPAGDRLVIYIEEGSHHASEQPEYSPGVEPAAADLAYIMYTSGSTGQPKGVMVGHGNVVSLVKEVDYVSLSEEDILLSTGSPSFDATTFEYWSMLLNGGQLVLCPERGLSSRHFRTSQGRFEGSMSRYFQKGLPSIGGRRNPTTQGYQRSVRMRCVLGFIGTYAATILAMRW
jgi:non-ribosomal peptide synthetase component F